LVAWAATLTMTCAMAAAVNPTNTAFVDDPLFLEHDTGPGFPESADRLRWLIAHLDALSLGSKLTRMAPDQDIDPRPWIAKVHDPDYIAALRSACEEGKKFMGDSSDSPISRRSYDAAVRAVGAALTAVDAVMTGRARNAFAAVRPPGHHAMPEGAKGFCLFGNAAIAARYAQEKHGIKRVMIIDWDVHHGDGTQEIFYDDPSVFFFSTHQYPFYPGPSGAAEKDSTSMCRWRREAATVRRWKLSTRNSRRHSANSVRSWSSSRPASTPTRPIRSDNSAGRAKSTAN
jgi:acetoin utilization deacetylase AcuC-like enzyme